MKKVIICLSLLSLILSGCYNYKDIDTLEFVTAILIDVNEQNKVVLYTRANKGIRSTDVAQESLEIIRFTEEGDTLFEAVRKMSLFTSSKLNYTQMRAIIMTERAAEAGLDFFIDFVERDQELNLRSRLFIFRGEPLDIINLDLTQEDFLGLYLWDLTLNAKYISQAVDMPLNELLNASYSPSSTYLLPIIEIINTVGTPQLAINGSIVMEKWNTVEEISKEDVLYYSFLNNRVKSSILNVQNPQNLDYKIAFEVLKSKTKTSSTYKEDTLHVTKKIELAVTIGDIQKELDFTNDVIKTLEKELSDKVTKNCTELFNRSKRKNIDIISAKNLCYKKYPRMDYDDILSRTILTVETNVTIKGSTNIINYQMY